VDACESMWAVLPSEVIPLSSAALTEARAATRAATSMARAVSGCAAQSSLPGDWRPGTAQQGLASAGVAACYTARDHIIWHPTRHPKVGWGGRAARPPAHGIAPAWCAPCPAIPPACEERTWRRHMQMSERRGASRRCQPQSGAVPAAGVSPRAARCQPPASASERRGASRRRQPQSGAVPAAGVSRHAAPCRRATARR
jgi:hypothetical protein